MCRDPQNDQVFFSSLLKINTYKDKFKDNVRGMNMVSRQIMYLPFYILVAEVGQWNEIRPLSTIF